MPEWNVPHSPHLTVPFRSRQPHVGQAAKSAYVRRGSASTESLHEHIFLVTCDDVAGFIFFDGDGFFFIIKFDDGSKDFLVIKTQSNVGSDVDFAIAFIRFFCFFVGFIIR